MSIEATYHSEVRFVRSAHSSKTGTTITLALPDSDELSKVAGFDGKRYMLALVEIGDDEQPVQQPSPPEVGYTPPTPDVPAKPKGGALAKLAGRWCQDPMFWAWLETDPLNAARSTTGAAACVYALCEIGSRADLDHNQEAAEKFHRLIRGPFIKYMASRGARFTAPEVEHA